MTMARWLEKSGAKAGRGPVPEQGSADDVLLGEKTPHVRIVTVVAIVAKDHDKALRNDLGSPIIIRILFDKWFIPHLSVNREFAGFDKDGVAATGHDAFDKSVFFAVAPVAESLRGFKNDNVIGFWTAKVFGDFVDDELITDVEGGEHGETWDVTGFNDESSD